MKSNLSLQRGLLDVLIKNAAKYPESEQWDKIMENVARMSVMRNVFSVLYITLTRKKELKPMEEMPELYQKELLDAVDIFCPEELEKEEREKFQKSIMSVNWLLSN